MILVLVLAAVFALAGAAFPLARAFGRNVGYVLAAGFAAGTALLAANGPAVLDGEPVTWSTSWLDAVGISFALTMDSLGLLFALIVLGIGTLVMAYGARYFSASGNHGRIFSLLTFFAGSMLGLVLADDVIMLFVFWELTSVSSFFLIGGRGEGRSGATRAFLTTALGGLALMAGLLLLGVDAGTFRLSEIAAIDGLADSSLAPAIVVLLLLGAFTKSAQFPFHFWLPGAMVAPTPVSTYLHAATMVKAGIYLMMRMNPVYGGMPLWQYTLIFFGLGTALLGAVIAVTKHDLKSLLAYSTVSQLGLITAVVGIGTPLAMAAAALHTFAHSLFKATLFMTVGIVDHEAGSRDIRVLHRLRQKLPAVALAGGLASLSMAGLPPLLGFISKEEAFAALIEVPNAASWVGPVAGTLGVLASIFTFAYTARYYWGTFESDGDASVHVHAAPGGFVAPALVTGIAGLVMGLAVGVLNPLVNGVATVLAGESAELKLALWHGFKWPLYMSVAVIVGGAALFVARERVERVQERLALPLHGERTFDGLYDRTLKFGKLVGRPAHSNVPATYLLPLLGAIVVLGASVAWVGVDIGGEPASSQMLDWVVVALVFLSVAGVVFARTRIGSVATLGLTGFLIAIWFAFLGAPDLALTQLLVETLTIALVVVVFRRLPPRFFRVPTPRRLWAGVTAVFVGTFAGVATYLLTGRRGLSEPGAWYVANAEEVTGGANIVNTILVDFRALDTLGEIVVIAVAALGIYAMARLASEHSRPGHEGDDDDVAGPVVVPDRRSRL